MKMYEEILDIVGKKGTASIPLICQEMSERSSRLLIGPNAIEQSYIKSLISRKNEIFLVKDDVVSIRPDKEPVSLTFVMHGYPGPEYKVKIDFAANRFTYFEWHLDSVAPGPIAVTHPPGSVEQFRKRLYSLNIWAWEEDYQAEGIIVDGTSWSVKLETKGKVYESGGLDSFPKEWRRFCRMVSWLIGKEIDH